MVESSVVRGSVPGRGFGVRRAHLRIIAAIVFGVFAAWESYTRLSAHPEINALDFTYPWRAAVHLAAGRDPYQNMPHAPYTLGGPLLYPLPTAVLVLPLAHLSIQIAGAVFTSLSIALLTFALTRRAWWPLMMMLSAPFFLALWNVQWSMLLVACALLPGLGWLGVAKPNLGLMVFAIRPRWWTVIGSVALCIGCLFLIPNWPQEWMDHLRRQPSPHPPAVLWPFGFVGLVGLLRWRTLEGRALVAATLSPSSAWFYDQLFVMLVARNWRQALALGALSWISFIMVLATQAPINLIDPDRARGVQRIISLGVYLPAAILVLRQRNEGDVPDRVERLIARLPRWVRGVSSRSVRVGDPPQP